MRDFSRPSRLNWHRHMGTREPYPIRRLLFGFVWAAVILGLCAAMLVV